MILQRIWKTAGLMLLFCGLARGSVITSFDAPGAGTGPAQGTFSLSINPAGTITGYYTDGNDAAHGFLRAADGVITTFNAPGAGTSLFEGTFPVAISLTGEVTGNYVDANFVAHGFVRAINGTITSFDAPGAAAGLIGTFPSSFSPQGVVIGNFFDANVVSHGFLRAPDGVVTVLPDDPNAGTGFFEGTLPFGMDPAGTIAGCFSFTSTTGFFNGFNFLRTSRGAYRTLNPPGGSPSFFGCGGFVFSVLPFGISAINTSGVIAGSYFETIAGDVFGGNFRGFVRALDGTFATFDAVSSPTSPCCTWTFPTSINPEGEVAGYDNDFLGINHAFIRAPNGAITVFDGPVAGNTVAASVNPAGAVTGYFSDANAVAHGFLRTP